LNGSLYATVRQEAEVWQVAIELEANDIGGRDRSAANFVIPRHLCKRRSSSWHHRPEFVTPQAKGKHQLPALRMTQGRDIGKPLGLAALRSVGEHISGRRNGGHIAF
jgi:hypothetical protein